MTPLRTHPIGVLRLNCRLARLPLQLVDDVAMVHLDRQAPARLAYQRFLIGCDRTAAYLLNDETAARRAAASSPSPVPARGPILANQILCGVRRRWA
ncbi:hypothetical protein [Rhodococcus wratislaviensis]|uniref:hypothetical protein n=1 Tax=Rhodococcus wratislaviensis TaxID=44752 RepID=UPI003646BDF0